MATEWTVSDDGKRNAFKLRKGVQFHDGSTFDAEAVKFNFERMLHEDHPYHSTGPFPLSFFFNEIKDIKVVDSHTIEFLST